MQVRTLKLDPRLFQILFQAIFLTYGLLVLHWQPAPLHYAITIGGCLLFTWIAESLREWAPVSPFQHRRFKSAALSVLISAASICLLLKTAHWSVSVIAAALTVASKYLLRVRNKHIFNPSAFGIIATILLTGEGWLSPGQWGNQTVLFFAIITLGTIVVTRVQKLDVSLAFLLTFVGLMYWRQVAVLGWPMDYFLHTVSTGGLLLFTFFMISDPRTAPDHPVARTLWAVGIAIASFYLAAFKFQYSTPVWVIVFAAPFVPVLDAIFRAERFQWKAAPVVLRGGVFARLSHPLAGRAVGVLLLSLLIFQEAAAFCGFYVSKADGTLKNKTSQVIMVRDGLKNVITMYNDFQGAFKDFAMVVPVPVVLKKSDIRVVDQSLFTTLNEYSKPRLVEYYDENPCERSVAYEDYSRKSLAYAAAPLADIQRVEKKKVRIEAQYIVGEYDILILSATESSALKTWLTTNGYKIPPNAEEVLEPYIKSNLKFFVVKVNEEEKSKLPGNFLRPLQITFSSPKFMLPIRLGMANADGDQDLLVYAFTRKGRVELTNYRTVSIPTSKNVPLFVKDNFSAFYSNLFEHQWRNESKSVGMLEYAWDVSPQNFMKCDPCVATAPNPQDLVQAGVWWLNGQDQQYDPGNAQVFFTRLHLRYNRQSFPQDLQFQLTPNTENFQARYIVTHPAPGSLNCEAGAAYKKTLKQRRRLELNTLRALTGRGAEDWDMVGTAERTLPEELRYSRIARSGSRSTVDYLGRSSGIRMAQQLTGR